jgi:hypothetical protein
MTNTQTIYVELLDEGVVVYRPVEAIPDPDGVLRGALPGTPRSNSTAQASSSSIQLVRYYRYSVLTGPTAGMASS